MPDWQATWRRRHAFGLPAPASRSQTQRSILSWRRTACQPRAWRSLRLRRQYRFAMAAQDARISKQLVKHDGISLQQGSHHDENHVVKSGMNLSICLESQRRGTSLT